MSHLACPVGVAHRGNHTQLPPSGDSSLSNVPTQLFVAGVLDLVPWRQEMLEVKSRFVVLAVVAAAAVATALGNYGWVVPHK